jgi:hypothetical protein
LQTQVDLICIVAFPTLLSAGSRLAFRGGHAGLAARFALCWTGPLHFRRLYVLQTQSQLSTLTLVKSHLQRKMAVSSKLQDQALEAQRVRDKLRRTVAEVKGLLLDVEGLLRKSRGP